MLQKFTAGGGGNHNHSLNIYTYRGATGVNEYGDWYTSRFRIQGSVNNSKQGYIEFNPIDDGWGGGIGIYGNRLDDPLATNKNGITVNSSGIVTIDTEWSGVSNKLIVGGGITASGNITAGDIAATGTISGATISGTTISAGDIAATGTISTDGTISGATITGTTISAGDIAATGTISGATISGTTITAGTISATGTISTDGTISGATITGTTITGTNFVGVSKSMVSGLQAELDTKANLGSPGFTGTMNAVNINASGTISTTGVTIGTNYISTNGTITGATITGTTISASGTISTSGVTIGNNFISTTGVTIGSTGNDGYLLQVGSRETNQLDSANGSTAMLQTFTTGSAELLPRQPVKHIYLQGGY